MNILNFLFLNLVYIYIDIISSLYIFFLYLYQFSTFAQSFPPNLKKQKKIKKQKFSKKGDFKRLTKAAAAADIMDSEKSVCGNSVEILFFTKKVFHSRPTFFKKIKGEKYERKKNFKKFDNTAYYVCSYVISRSFDACQSKT